MLLRVGSLFPSSSSSFRGQGRSLASCSQLQLPWTKGEKCLKMHRDSPVMGRLLAFWPKKPSWKPKGTFVSCLVISCGQREHSCPVLRTKSTNQLLWHTCNATHNIPHSNRGWICALECFPGSCFILLCSQEGLMPGK